MSKIKILVVEDEGIVAMDIENTLTALGYYVPETVATGEKAIAKIEEYMPDLILMDIMLKGNMDGIEAANIIKQKYDIPVIFLTAFGDDNTLKRAKLSEPFGYILKPFEERELYITIEMALYKHGLQMRLKEKELLLSRIINSFDEIIISTDINRKIQYANRGVYEVFGLEENDIIGKNLNDIFVVENHNIARYLEGPISKILSVDKSELQGENVKIKVNNKNVVGKIKLNIIIDNEDKIRGLVISVII